MVPSPPLATLRSLATACLIAFGIKPTGMAGDWPQWRGPDRTGHASKDEPPLATLAATPRVVWKVRAGEGFGSPVVTGGRVFGLEARSGKEVLRALDAAEGRELWATVIDSTFTDSQGPPAPRGTPVVSGGQVYAQSCRGELVCLDASSGQRRWAVNYTRDFGANFFGEKGNARGSMRHGNTGSPWVEEGWVWASAGSTNGAGLIALDAMTGSVRWKGGNEVAGYAAPMMASLDGTRQVINFMADAAVGFDAKSGIVLWRYPLKTDFSRHVITPIIFGNQVILGSHQTGLIGLHVARKGGGWTVSETWNSREAAPNVACPVKIGDWIFGLGPQQNIICVSATDGHLQWSKKGWISTAPDKAHAGFIAIGEKTVLMLNDTGELILFAANATECLELGRVQVCGSNWCNPALAKGRLYLREGVRNSGSWMCLEL